MRLVALSCCALAAALAFAPQAEGQTKAPKPITLLGADKRTVALTPGASGELTGEVHLALRNNRKKKQLRVRLIYSRTEDGTVTTLPGANANPVVSAGPGKLSRDGSLVLIDAASVGQVALVFTAPAGASPTTLDGVLAVESRTADTKMFAPQLTVTLAGGIRPLGDVRFEPASLVIETTSYCPFRDECEVAGSKTVRLVGSDVASLVERVKASKQTSIATELRRGDGTPVTAKLSDLTLVENQPGTATAKIEVDGSTPGKYKGSIPLSRLAAKPPALAVEVNSRVSWIWCLLCIFAGVITAGLITQHIGLTRRRSLIRNALKREVEEYCKDRQNRNYPDDATEPLVREPDITCPLEDDPTWSYYEEPKTLAAVYTAAKWARNDADLDETETKGVALIAGLKTWRLMLTQVRALWDLARQPREDAESWKERRVGGDTELLLHHLKRHPVDPETESSVMDKLRQQVGWHGLFAEAWDLRAHLIGAGGPIAQKAKNVKLEERDTEAGDPWERTHDAQDKVEVELLRDLAKLKALQEKSNRDPETPTIEDPEVALDNVLRAEAIRGELASLGDVTANPRRSLAALDVHLALQPVPSAEDPVDARPEGEAEQQSGSAQQPEAQAAAAVATPPGVRAPSEAAAPAAPVPQESDSKPPSDNGSGSTVGLQLGLQRRDALLSVVILLLSSIVYSATKYDSTWGSLVDWATAFGAGFAGQVAVKWALLPIYRSIRLRGAPASAPQKEAEATT